LAMGSVEVPDLQSANTFIAGSYTKYSTCISSYEVMATASNVITTQAGSISAVAAQQIGSVPEQVISGLTLVVGIILMFLGYKLVRPVNFAAGAYLGYTASLILITIFLPSLSSCPAILATGTVSGLLVGLLCAMKRASVLAVLGVVAGEMIGDLFYKTFLAQILPEYVAFGCIGFFAVLLAVLSAYAGDFAFQAFCGFFGSYLVVVNVIKLVLVPYAPNGQSYLAFLSFKPELTQILVSGQAVAGSPYVLGPVVAVALLTTIGTYAQVVMLAKARQAEDTHRLIGK